MRNLNVVGVRFVIGGLSQSWLFSSFSSNHDQTDSFQTLLISSTCRTNAYNWTANPVLSSSMIKTVLLSGRCPASIQSPLPNFREVYQPVLPHGLIRINIKIRSIIIIIYLMPFSSIKYSNTYSKIYIYHYLVTIDFILCTSIYIQYMFS